MKTPLEEYPQWIFKPHLKAIPEIMAILTEERVEDRKKLSDLIRKNIFSYDTSERGRLFAVAVLIDDIIDYFRSKVSTKYFGLSKKLESRS